MGEEDIMQGETPRSAVLLERFFITGLQYLSQGVNLLTKLREKLGSNSSAAKTMIGLSMDQLRLAVGEFNIYLERQSEVLKEEENQGVEMQQIRRLLEEYREELENVKAKNRELRELLALKMDGRDRSREFPDEDYDQEINQIASKTRIKDINQNFLMHNKDADWGNTRVDEVTFGKNRPPSRIPIAEEMFKSNPTVAKGFQMDDLDQERHNRSYMSINLDKGFESNFGKKTKPQLFGSHGKKVPPKSNAYHTEGFKQSKGSEQLGSFADQLGISKSGGQSAKGAKFLEEEISELDAKILGLMSEVYDEFNIDLRKQSPLF